MSVDDEDRPASASEERRRLLRLGGTGAVAALILGACGQSRVSSSTSTTVVKAQQTGTTTTTDPNAPTPSAVQPQPKVADQQDDLALLRTLTSMEFAAANSYGAILSSGHTGGVEFTNLTTPLRMHHEAFAVDLQRSTRIQLKDLQLTEPRDFGQLDPNVVVYEPGKLDDPKGNAFFWDEYIIPGVEQLDEPAAVVTLARQIEDICAASHVLAVGTFTTVPPRTQSMGMASVEARASAVLAQLFVPPQSGAPSALFNTRNGLGMDGELTYDGSAKESK